MIKIIEFLRLNIGFVYKRKDIRKRIKLQENECFVDTDKRTYCKKDGIVRACKQKLFSKKPKCIILDYRNWT